MSELIVSPDRVKQVQKRDPLFARGLDDSRRSFLHVLHRAPGYVKTLIDQMQTEDVYRARIPRQVLDRLNKRDYEKILKNDSGLWNGMIRKMDGRKVIVKQAEWEKVQLDRHSLANLNQLAIQASIAEVTEQLLLMDQKLDLLLAGQHTDRIAKVQAGIHLYEQAYLYRDLVRRDQLLLNALQSLNESRTALFGELEAMLTHQKRAPILWDNLWRLLFRVDKPEVEFFNQLEAARTKVVESIKYVNLASAYIFRSHALLDEHEAAEHSKLQYIKFCNLVLGNVREEDSLHPYELVESTRGLKQLGARVESLTRVESDLVIETTYEELINDEV
jgi:hypothetical protein